MRLLIIFILALFSIQTNAANVKNGKFLFEDWGCKGCHGIGKNYNQDAEKGPNLLGIYSRRSKPWIKKFVKNPQAIVDSGDKDAVEMVKKYGKVMKTFKISDTEWDDILKFIK